MKVRIKEELNKRKEFELNKRKEFNEYMLKMAEEYNEYNEYLTEGTKVKLNYEWITEHPTYNKMQKAYKDFVENNKDTIFTVEYDKKHGSNSYMVCLKEDTTPVKWLWHSSSDLIVVENNI